MRGVKVPHYYDTTQARHAVVVPKEEWKKAMEGSVVLEVSAAGLPDGMKNVPINYHVCVCYTLHDGVLFMPCNYKEGKHIFSISVMQPARTRRLLSAERLKNNRKGQRARSSIT